MCIEVFGVELDVKICNFWNEEDILISIYCLLNGYSTDFCSSFDKESNIDSDIVIINDEVIEVIKSVKLKYCVVKELVFRVKIE